MKARRKIGAYLCIKYSMNVLDFSNTGFIRLNQMKEAKKWGWKLIKAYGTWNEHEIKGSVIQVNTHHLADDLYTALFYIRKDWSLNHITANSWTLKIKSHTNSLGMLLNRKMKLSIVELHCP